MTRKKLLQTSIEEIIDAGIFNGYTNRALRFLKSHNIINTVEDITKFTKRHIGRFRYMGPKAVDTVEAFLKSKKLSFSEEPPVSQQVEEKMRE